MALKRKAESTKGASNAGNDKQMTPKNKKSRKDPKSAADKSGIRDQSAMPPAYTAQQKNAISEFISFTQADKTTAARILKQYNWNIDNAANGFFNDPSHNAPNPARTTISKIFDKYRDNPKDSPDEIGLEGASNLLGELGIELDHVDVFVFSELVKSTSIGVIQRDNFVEGFSDHSADTLPKMRNVVIQRRSQLDSNPELFKKMYNHAFQLGLSDRQRALGVEEAVGFWTVLLNEPGFKWKTENTAWLELWFEFYTTEVNKAVTKDLWQQILPFAKETMKDESLSFCTDESSWPSVIDQFVEWIRAKRSNGDQMDQSS